MNIIASNEKISVMLVAKSEAKNLFTCHEFIEHQKLVQDKEVLTFALVDNVSGKRIAIHSFSRSKNTSTWYAPVTGAFSSLEASEFISMMELDFFIETISSYLLAIDNMVEIVWRTPPQYYQNKVHSKLQNVMFRQGWRLTTFDINFHMRVDSYDSFKSNLSSSKRRELNRITKKIGINFSEVFSLEEKASVYEVIKANRESQGYPMTMSWEDIQSLECAIGSNIQFFRLNQNENILAGAICLVLDNEVLYVFYWGENPLFRKDSPIIKLAEGIFLNAMDKKFKVIDIGTSTNASEPNQGLINFKENIGCEGSSKLTYSFKKSGN